MEEEFDEVALAVLRNLSLPLRLRADNGLDAASFELGAGFVGVVAVSPINASPRAKSSSSGAAISSCRSPGGRTFTSTIAWTWLKSLLESVPEHCFGSPFSARRILMRADHGAVDDRRRFINVDFEAHEPPGPRRPSSPSSETGCRRTSNFRSVPAETRFVLDDCIDEEAVTLLDFRQATTVAILPTARVAAYTALITTTICAQPRRVQLATHSRLHRPDEQAFDLTIRPTTPS